MQVNWDKVDPEALILHCKLRENAAIFCLKDHLYMCMSAANQLRLLKWKDGSQSFLMMEQLLSEATDSNWKGKETEATRAKVIEKKDD